MPFTATAQGDRFDLRQAARWYTMHVLPRRKGHAANGDGAPDVGVNRDCVERLTTIHNKALREHLIGLQTEPAIERFVKLLQALGFDDRQRYLAMRALQLHVGASAPGDAAVLVLDPADPPAATWEGEFRALVRDLMNAAR